MTLEQLPPPPPPMILLLEDSEEKKKLLNVSTLSDVEESYSLSALKILKKRYLLKDDQGNTIERSHELLARVAVGVGVMELLYDGAFYTKEGRTSIENTYYKKELKKLQDELKDLDYKDMNQHPLCIKLPYGFTMNPFHYERLLARYIELWDEGRMKVSFDTLMNEFEKDNTLKLKIIPLIQRYYDLMRRCVFLPNTPALMNCGTKLGMNAACFTLEIKDDLDHIYKTNWDVAKVFKAGGGIGINYSGLRPEGAFVKGTGGKSSGTLSWLKQTDETTGRVAQGGKRRGASMGILNIEHPEIDRFIEMKSDNKSLLNHNISVCAPNTFFEEALSKNNNSRSSQLLDKIVKNAWISGDPGMVFLDNMNSNNLLQPVFDGKPIDVTNPCSEISMYPYESCILASINLTKFVKYNKFNYEEFADVTKTVTQFLDSMIDATKYPIDEINKMTKNCRRIGVGFMGLADTLVQLKIPYNSKEGFDFTEKISACMTLDALDKSSELAEQKGAFPLWYDDKYPKEKLPIIGDSILGLHKKHGLRNCSVTTVAPTGTLSMLTDCSSGIEPLFSLKYIKKVTIGEFEYLDKNYKQALNSGMSEQDIKRIFVTAMDIHPYDHLMMQAVAQKWITNGISKTVNMASDVTEKMIEHAYVLSWALGNKGISIYRDGCKGSQVLNSDRKLSSVDLKISDYTAKEISELKNIPDEYKQEILSHENKFGVARWIIEDTFITKCDGCGSMNTLQNNGSKSCFICTSCGHRIGSCN